MNTEEILAELRELLESGDLVALRHSLGETYAPNVQLQRYKDRVYLFPFGRQPKRGPMIYLNGLVQTEGTDYNLWALGSPEKTQIVALGWTFDLRPDDVVTARYFVE